MKLYTSIYWVVKQGDAPKGIFKIKYINEVLVYTIKFSSLLFYFYIRSNYVKQELHCLSIIAF